jgi:hypothetical protein
VFFTACQQFHIGICLSQSIERVDEFIIFGNNVNKSKFDSGRNEEQIEARQCLLLFGSESFVFQIAIQKFKDQDI